MSKDTMSRHNWRCYQRVVVGGRRSSVARAQAVITRVMGFDAWQCRPLRFGPM